MGTSFHEKVKDIIAAVTKFVEETLAKEKLSSKTQDERNRIKDQINNIKEEFPALKSESDWGKDNTRPDVSPPPKNASTNELYEAAADSAPISGAEMVNSSKMNGHLKKRSGGIFSGTQKKWCAVRETTLYFYEKPSDKKQKGQIELKDVTVKKIDGGSGKKSSYGFEIVTSSGESYVFLANNEQELDKWMDAINSNTDDDDDGMELYEEMDKAEAKKFQPLPKPKHVPQPQHAPKPQVFADDDIYVDDPVPVESKGYNARQSDIYDDNLKDTYEEETYDDVAEVRPPPPRPSPVPPHKPAPTMTSAGGTLDYTKLYYALWSRHGEDIDELSFQQADILLVKNKAFDQYSWWAAEVNGRVGYVPKTFLSPVYIPA